MCGNGLNSASRDQTPTDAITDLRQKGIDLALASGTGLYLVPDPSKGENQVKKIVVEDITYDEFIRRSLGCLAYKWLPYDHIAKEKLRKELARRGSCQPSACINGSGCPAQCICFNHYGSLINNCW